MHKKINAFNECVGFTKKSTLSITVLGAHKSQRFFMSVVDAQKSQRFFISVVGCAILISHAYDCVYGGM